MSKLSTVIVVGLIFATGCATSKTLSVRSDPPGATVTLTRYCQDEVTVHTHKALGTVPVGDCETPPIYLGTTPLVYEYVTQETLGHAHVPVAGVSATRRYTEGVVRVEKDGAVAEQRVSFTGQPITVDMRLEPRADAVSVAPTNPAPAQHYHH